MLTDPENLRPKETTLLEKIAACPEMTALADLVRDFAALLKPAEGNDIKLTEWITTARAIDLPHLRSFTNGLEIDRSAVPSLSTLHRAIRRDLTRGKRAGLKSGEAARRAHDVFGQRSATHRNASRALHSPTAPESAPHRPADTHPRVTNRPARTGLRTHSGPSQRSDGATPRSHAGVQATRHPWRCRDAAAPRGRKAACGPPCRASR
ncbi:hypothetical protein ACFY2M_37875 [Streptomyces sp. NPDC001276]|uniref:hypothetical protein n=1 Tax=Streptomyces sp. NPDC001276 TaxID=3364555 RepID=UPI003692CED7